MQPGPSIEEDLIVFLKRKGIEQHHESLHQLGFQKKTDFQELKPDDIPKLFIALGLNFVDEIKLRNIIQDIQNSSS